MALVTIRKGRRMSDDWTPTTDSIRQGYFDGKWDAYHPDYTGEKVFARFDRWLEAHDDGLRRETVAQVLGVLEGQGIGLDSKLDLMAGLRGQAQEGAA